MSSIYLPIAGSLAPPTPPGTPGCCMCCPYPPRPAGMTPSNSCTWRRQETQRRKSTLYDAYACTTSRKIGIIKWIVSDSWYGTLSKFATTTTTCGGIKMRAPPHEDMLSRNTATKLCSFFFPVPLTYICSCIRFRVLIFCSWFDRSVFCPLYSVCFMYRSINLLLLFSFFFFFHLRLFKFLNIFSFHQCFRVFLCIFPPLGTACPFCVHGLSTRGTRHCTAISGSITLWIMTINESVTPWRMTIDKLTTPWIMTDRLHCQKKYSVQYEM